MNQEKKSVGRPPKRKVPADPNDEPGAQPEPKRPIGRPPSVAQESDESHRATRADDKKLVIKPVSSVWNELVGDEIVDKFNPGFLPQNRKIMLRFESLKKEGDKELSNHDYARLLFIEIQEIWGKSYIPTVDEKNCIWKIKTLIDSWVKESCRKFTKGSEKWKKYDAKLNKLCDLAPPDIEEQLKRTRASTWLEDLTYYHNMKVHPQIGCMMSPDTKLIKKQKRSEDRRNKQKKREENEELRRQEDNAVMDPSVEEEIEENEAENP